MSKTIYAYDQKMALCQGCFVFLVDELPCNSLYIQASFDFDTVADKFDTSNSQYKPDMVTSLFTNKA